MPGNTGVTAVTLAIGETGAKIAHFSHSAQRTVRPHREDDCDVDEDLLATLANTRSGRWPTPLHGPLREHETGPFQCLGEHLRPQWEPLLRSQQAFW